MRNSWLSLLLLLTGFALQCPADLIIATNSTSQSIPDNNSLGISQTITISNIDPGLTIESITVSLRLSGPDAYNGDYFVSLLHGETYAVLLNGVGRTGSNPFGYNNNGFDVTFTAGGADIHTYQTGAYALGPSGELTGEWGPDGRIADPLTVLDIDSRTASLGAFTGQSPNGEWTLFLADVRPGGQGQIQNWSLNITAVPEPATLVFMLFGCVLIVGRCRTTNAQR